jgi:CBS domain containing-hemolysin-like protein
MQSNRQKIVSVVDEYGGCDGIVTIEDIIEEVVGEIAEDHEEFEPLIQDDGDRRFRVDASIDIEDLNDELDLNLRKDGFDTLAGYLLKVFGRIPEVGEKVVSEDLEFEILQKEHLAIVEVRLKMLTVD